MNRRQVLSTTGAVASLGLCAGIVASAPGCTPAPAAEPVNGELAFAIKRHRAAFAASEASGHVQSACDRARGILSTPDTEAAFRAADDAFNLDCGVETVALDALIAAPILTLTDMRAKAAYLGNHLPGTCEDSPAMRALLASMGASIDNMSAVPVMSAEPDPMLAMILQCRAGLAVANGKGTTAEVDAAMEPVGALYDELESRTPRVTTERGALEALRFAHETMEHTQEAFIEPVIGAVLTYFDGRA